MTVTRNSIEIAAPVEVVYRLGSRTERWPQLLPHYRYVRVLAEHGDTRTVAMGAWRDAFPIGWTAVQTNDPVRPHIGFRHIRGWTRGMEVEWLFEPCAVGTRVTIEHRLQFAFPLASAWLGKHVVSAYFVHGVATKTLARMKQLAESREGAQR